MSTDFTFSELYSSSNIIRFYTSISGIDFNFTEDGYTAVSGSVDFSFGDSQIIYRYILPKGNNFKAIWADSFASKDNGKMYIASPDSFVVVDLLNKSIYDIYTKEISGRSEEKLLSDDIIDINVAGF